MDLKANTAVDVLLGPFVDNGDGDTTEDALTLLQADIKLSKNGQALTQKSDDTTAAFDDDGYYNCELDTTDVNTEGQLVLIVHKSGSLPVRHEYRVLSEAAYDSLYVAKDVGFLDVNVKTIGRADAQETEANNLEAACAAYSATRGLTGTAVPAVAAEAAGGIYTRGTGAGQINQPANGSIDANVNAISDDTTAAANLELQYDGTGLLGDAFPLRQDQGASISGGLAIHTAMASVTVIQGSQQDLGNAATSDDTRWTGDDDGAGAEFIFRCTPADTDARPGDLHFEGYYDEPSGATNGATLEIYNFQSAAWDSILTLTNSSSDEDHDIALLHGHRAPGGGTLETVAEKK